MKKVKVIICLFFIAMSFACKKNAQEIDWNKELLRQGEMGESYIQMYKKGCIGQCQWTRISASVLKFEGVIAKESYDEFMLKVDDKVNEIVLNSAGGLVSSALSIATEIQRRNLKVTVKGFCISSCANYLFLSGKEKKIDGVLGYHGNTQALYNGSTCADNLSATQCSNVKKERAFLESIGMTNLLFDVTQGADKGMKDGKNYNFYAPSAETLKALGVKGITGNQRSDYLAQMKKIYDEFELPEFAIATDPNPTITAKLNESKTTLLTK